MTLQDTGDYIILVDIQPGQYAFIRSLDGRRKGQHRHGRHVESHSGNKKIFR